MADKEERILIARSTDYTITDTDEGALFDGKIAPHCANVMTVKIEMNMPGSCMGCPLTYESHFGGDLCCITPRRVQGFIFERQIFVH